MELFDGIGGAIRNVVGGISGAIGGIVGGIGNAVGSVAQTVVDLNPVNLIAKLVTGGLNGTSQNTKSVEPSSDDAKNLLRLIKDMQRKGMTP